MHAAAGDVQRAAELEQTAVAQLATVGGAESSPSDRLEPGAALRDPPDRPRAGLTPRPPEVER